MADDQSPHAPPTPAVADREAPREAYFTVGAVKFSLMSLTTFQFYVLYWFYRNWLVIREREHSSISPFWRAFFTSFWIFSMGTRFVKQAKAQNLSITLPVGELGILYLVWGSLWQLPGPYWWLVSLLSFIAILPFEYAARRLNGSGRLAEPTYGRYSGWTIAWIIIGSLFLLLSTIGMFLSD